MAVLKYRRSSDGAWVTVGLAGATGPTGDQGPVGNQGGPGPAGDDHYWMIHSGQQTVTPVANTNTVSPTIYFATAYRTGVVPTVVASMYTTVPGTIFLSATVHGIAEDSFLIYVYRTNTTNCWVTWFAVGER